jgi:hypothetical protein
VPERSSDEGSMNRLASIRCTKAEMIEGAQVDTCAIIRDRTQTKKGAGGLQGDVSG